MYGIMERVRDKTSRFYGFQVMEVEFPESPDYYMSINMAGKLIIINKSAREGANAVYLTFEQTVHV